MNVSVGSDGGRHRYRKNIVYKSLRRSSSQIIVNIKKEGITISVQTGECDFCLSLEGEEASEWKINEAEKSVRYRRALRPLNESRSPSPAPQMRIVAPAPIFGKKNVHSTPKAFELNLNGYTFDNGSNILRTPDSAPTPPICQKKTGVVAHLREMATLISTRKGLRQNCSPNAVRLAKQVARTRIREIQSPKRPLLDSSMHDRDGDLFSELKGLQRPH